MVSLLFDYFGFNNVRTWMQQVLWTSDLKFWEFTLSCVVYEAFRGHAKETMFKFQCFVVLKLCIKVFRLLQMFLADPAFHTLETAPSLLFQ